MSKTRIVVRVILAVAAAGVLSASAADFSGNPAADGWYSHGNSLALGTYIRGVGGWGFDVYSHNYVLGAADLLVNGTSWLAGDQIIALGGVMDDQFFVPRVVAKFGAAGSLFSASSFGSPFGDGSGSFSDGDGGEGSVQIDYLFGYTGDTLNPGQNGITLTPDNVRYYQGGTTFVSTDFGRVLAVFAKNGSDQDQLQSFEVILNLSALSDPGRGNKTNAVPLINGISNMAIQESLGVYTDGLADRSAIPEPSALLLVALTVMGAVGVVKRSR